MNILFFTETGFPVMVDVSAYKWTTRIKLLNQRIAYAFQDLL